MPDGSFVLSKAHAYTSNRKQHTRLSSTPSYLGPKYDGVKGKINILYLSLSNLAKYNPIKWTIRFELLIFPDPISIYPKYGTHNNRWSYLYFTLEITSNTLLGLVVINLNNVKNELHKQTSFGPGTNTVSIFWYLIVSVHCNNDHY